MAGTVMQKIEELSRRREELLAKEGSHHITREEREQLAQIDHDLRVLWDLRRRELAGERVDLGEDFYDRYDRYTGGDSPGGT